jgi:antibiotic biosynthesis monooxygenase (ABM) superfamily enzyme
MAAVILLAIFPLLMIVVPVMGWLFGDHRLLAIPIDFNVEFATRTFLNAAILVTLMTWVAMPRLTRALRRWLYRAE